MFLTLQQQRFLYFFSVRNPNSRFPLQQQRFLYVFKSHEIPRYSMGSHELYHSRDFYIFLRNMSTNNMRFSTIVEISISFQVGRPRDGTRLYDSRDFYMFSSPKNQHQLPTLLQQRFLHTFNCWDGIRIYIYNSKYFYMFSRGFLIILHNEIRTPFLCFWMD